MTFKSNDISKLVLLIHHNNQTRLEGYSKDDLIDNDLLYNIEAKICLKIE